MRNDWYIKAGKDFIAFSILAIGSIHVIFQNFPKGLLPVPDAIPGRNILVYISAVIMIGSSVLLMLRRYVGAFIPAVWFLLLFLLLIPALIKNPYDPNGWTSSFEILSFMSGALLLAGIFLPREKKQSWMIGSGPGLLMAGRYVFATCLIVFGVQHYIYRDFLIDLIPAWIPLKPFFETLVMVAFFSIGLSLFLRQMERLAAALLSFMFFIWFWLLHLPRVMAHPAEETEWTSMFITMAFCGIGLLIVGTSRYGKE